MSREIENHEAASNELESQDGAQAAGDGRVMRKKHLAVSARMLALAVGMFGFGYLMVPLYDIICEVTGLNGKTGRISVAESETRLLESRNAAVGPDGKPAIEREIIVEFVGIVSAGGNWKFKPNETEMRVKPGQQYLTSYYAENLSTIPVVGQASPSVSPSAAARYFNKTECFCFTRQEFEAKGSRDMPVTFVIDPDIPINVDRVTLSYTFFKSADQTLSSVDLLNPAALLTVAAN